MNQANAEKYLTIEAIELIEEGDESFEKEFSGFTGREIAGSSPHPMSSPVRTLAFIKFVLCHSLPKVNENGATWTYATLVNSLGTVQNQLIDLNHMMADNGPVLFGIRSSATPDRVIGHMLSAEIGEAEGDQLCPDKPVPVVVKGVLYKRARGVQEILDRIKSGKPVKVSMECEYAEMGYYYDGKLYSEENQELSTAVKRKMNNLRGKPIGRVLGGVGITGGVVNFHGAAVLLDEKPADAGAGIQTAVAQKLSFVEVGGSEMSSVVIEEDSGAGSGANAGKEESMTSDELLYGKVGTDPAASVYNGDLNQITLETLAKGQAAQEEAIRQNNETLARLINGLEKANVIKVQDEPRNLDIDGDGDPKPGEDEVTDENTPIDPNTMYADPGYLPTKLPAYPLKTPDDVVSAWCYFARVENLQPYTPDQARLIQERIMKMATALDVTLPNPILDMASGGTEASSTPANEVHQMDSQTTNSGVDNAPAEEIATKQKTIEHLSAENDSLRSQMEEMSRTLSDLRNEKMSRERADRAATRKAIMMKTCGMTDELASHLHNQLHDMDDEDFTKFHNMTKMLVDHGKALALIGDNGAGIVAPNTGRVADAIMSNNSAGIIGNNGSGIVGNNSSGLVGDNGAGVVSNHGSGSVNEAANAPMPGNSDFKGTIGDPSPDTPAGLIEGGNTGGKPSHPSQEQIKATKGDPSPEDPAEPKHTYVEGASQNRVPYAPVPAQNTKKHNRFLGM